MEDSSTRRIYLSGKQYAGLFALVDEQDFDYLNGFKWYYLNGYAIRNSIPQTGAIRMHREIMPCVAPFQVDHINGDRFDNRRCNLRVVTFHQNTMNRKKSRANTSGFTGVFLEKRAVSKPWYAKIGAQINGKSRLLHLGCFATPEEASVAYEAAALKIFGEYRRQ